MVDNFNIVVVTTPEPVDNEAIKIEKLLAAGADYVSIRKPNLGERYVADLLENIRPELRCRIKLHDYPELARAFKTGFQLNSRNKKVDALSPSLLSRGCHSLSEVAESNDLEYVTLSPIFDSISKPGYKAKFDLNSLNLKSFDSKIIALGGITLDHLPDLRKAGFAGAAFLGEVWRDQESFDRFIRYLAIRNSRVQYITDGSTPDDTIRLASAALNGGCKWVQIRMKDQPIEAVTEVAEELAPAFTNRGCTLIVDDHVEIAASISGVAGVHLGQNDLSPIEARHIMPNDKILGFTVNSVEHLKNAANLYRDHIDYLGMGPLRFTSTKKKLAPTLGFDGLADIRSEMDKLSFIPPAVIVGGITSDDFEQLANIKFGGVAVSGAIGKSPSPIDATSNIVKSAYINFGHRFEEDYI
ncbi:MAG: thiamine phosphate synthase, partial [Muribaculaceae bacterium]|nr:thiamine phosphate synthase [Muribaculaceae bacterium]